jgi:hypothetical protein
MDHDSMGHTGAPSALRTAIMTLFVSAFAACGGHRAADGQDAGGLVPECVAYQQAFARCSGVDASIASQPAAIPSSDADRTRIARLCASNLQRLRETCR